MNEIRTLFIYLWIAFSLQFTLMGEISGIIGKGIMWALCMLEICGLCRGAAAAKVIGAVEAAWCIFFAVRTEIIIYKRCKRYRRKKPQSARSREKMYKKIKGAESLDDMINAARES